MKRTHSQQAAHLRVLQSNLRTLATHPRGRDILNALVTLADCGPYDMWAGETVLELVHSIVDNDADDIAALCGAAALQRLAPEPFDPEWNCPEHFGGGVPECPECQAKQPRPLM